MIRSKLSRSAVGAAIGTAVAIAMSTAVFTPVFADTPAPSVTWNSQIADGASFVYDAVPAAPTCAPDPSDTAVVCVVLGYSDQVGTWTLTPQLQDAVTAAPLAVQPTQTITYTVTAWRIGGFYSPVKKKAPALNKVTAGSTVPLKFKVWYDGRRKHLAKDTSVVDTFGYLPIDCTTKTAVAGATETSLLNGTGRHALKYYGKTFHLNWATPKAEKPAGKPVKGAKKVASCYQVTMTTDSGSSIQALFSVK